MLRLILEVDENNKVLFRVNHGEVGRSDWQDEVLHAKHFTLEVSPDGIHFKVLDNEEAG